MNMRVKRSFLNLAKAEEYCAFLEAQLMFYRGVVKGFRESFPETIKSAIELIEQYDNELADRLRLDLDLKPYLPDEKKSNHDQETNV
jgi:hypothetical protein